MAKYKTLSMRIGSKWPGEKSDDINALLDMLEREPLDPRRGPFVVACKVGRTEHRASGVRYVDTKVPVYPKHPRALNFSGNFWHVNYPFSIDTADRELIAVLRMYIKKNLKTHPARDLAVTQ